MRVESRQARCDERNRDRNHQADDESAVAAYGAAQSSQFIDPRIGCRVLTSAAHGLDLAALCLNG
jgi:hypothetical protein